MRNTASRNIVGKWENYCKLHFLHPQQYVQPFQNPTTAITFNTSSANALNLWTGTIFCRLLKSLFVDRDKMASGSCQRRRRSSHQSLRSTKKSVTRLLSRALYRLQTWTLFRNKPLFLRISSTSLLKTLQEKEKLLVTRNFSFSHSVFLPFGKLTTVFIKFQIVICKLRQFSKRRKFVGWERNKMFGKCYSRKIIRFFCSA